MENQAQRQDELFDVVNINDEVVDVKTRGFIHKNKLMHRSVHIFVFNSKKQLWLQKRSMLKDTCKGLFTASCSGHLDSGETYEQAAIREIKEENGIVIDDLDKLKYIGKISPCKESGWEWTKVFTYIYDGEIVFDKLEIEGGMYLTKEEIDLFLEKDPNAFSPSFIKIWENFFR